MIEINFNYPNDYFIFNIKIHKIPTNKQTKNNSTNVISKEQRNFFKKKR